MTENKKLPIIQVKDRTLSVSIFERITNDLSTNEESRSYGACCQRSYKKKDSDQWEREQINMFPEDMLKMANLLTKAYNHTTDHINELKQLGKNKSDYPGSSMGSGDDTPPAYLNDDIPF